MADAIVVTYNSAASISACIEALLKADLHVVVVDNAATAEVVRKQFPQVELIANDENVGVARAVHQGLALCRADVVMLVNPDTVMPAAAAKALVAYLRDHPDVAVVGPRLREADGSINISAYPAATVGSMLLTRARRFFPFLTPVLAHGKRFRSYEACLHATEATEVDMVCAAC